MRKVLVAVAALATAFAISGLAATDADAKKHANKRCIATDNAGKKVSFKCAATEKCCWQPLIQKGACVPANGICL